MTRRSAGSFIERVFAMARWRTFVTRRPGPGDLVAFHTAQKFAVLAHSPSHYATLGRLVAAAGGSRLAARLTEYGSSLMDALSIRATRARHANVLQHLAGVFKRRLEVGERAEIADVIHDYRLGLVPLIVRAHPDQASCTSARRRLSSADQVYLSPHPKELMLRNHV